MQIDIYEDGESGWLLEVVDEFNNSTVWEDPFETDESALNEAINTIKTEGIASLIGTETGVEHWCIILVQRTTSRSSGQCEFWFFCAFHYATLLHKRTKIRINKVIGLLPSKTIAVLFIVSLNQDGDGVIDVFVSLDCPDTYVLNEEIREYYQLLRLYTPNQA